MAQANKQLFDQNCIIQRFAIDLSHT